MTPLARCVDSQRDYTQGQETRWAHTPTVWRVPGQVLPDPLMLINWLKLWGFKKVPVGKGQGGMCVCVYVCVFVCVCLAGLKWTSGPLLITEPFRGDNTVENGVLVWMEWAGPLMEQRISQGFCFEAACLLTCFWEAGLTKSPRVCNSILCKLLKFCF